MPVFGAIDHRASREAGHAKEKRPGEPVTEDKADDYAGDRTYDAAPGCVGTVVLRSLIFL